MFDQRADELGLAHTRSAEQQHHTRAVSRLVFHRRQCFLAIRRRKEKVWIRAVFKWRAAKPEEFGVHRSGPLLDRLSRKHCSAYADPSMRSRSASKTGFVAFENIGRQRRGLKLSVRFPIRSLTAARCPTEKLQGQRGSRHRQRGAPTDSLI